MADDHFDRLAVAAETIAPLTQH